MNKRQHESLTTMGIGSRKTQSGGIGSVHAVRGAVVDVRFDDADLPPINTALVVEWDRSEQLLLEVHSHLDLTTLRAVAFQATAGPARGVAGLCCRDRSQPDTEVTPSHSEC